MAFRDPLMSDQVGKFPDRSFSWLPGVDAGARHRAVAWLPGPQRGVALRPPTETAVAGPTFGPVVPRWRSWERRPHRGETRRPAPRRRPQTILRWKSRP